MILSDLLKKNRDLHNRHAGRRCFIVGNGPSLQHQDISPLADEITIVVSWFHKHPLAKVIHPAYWVMADPGCWEQPDQPFLPALQNVHDLEIATRLFVPARGLNYYSGLHTAPFIDINYFHYDSSRTIDTPIDFTDGIPPFGQNVVIVCLMLAFYMGCNPIYLTGCDHDFLKVTRSEYEQKEERHFYHQNAPARFSAEFQWEEFQNCMARVVYEYRQLQEYASGWGYDVFNATRGGHLDIFPRVEFESLFTQRASINVRSASFTTEDLFRIAEAAVGMIESDNCIPALAMLDEAIRHNINRPERVQGLHYLKAVSLTKLNRHHEALQAARLDLASNPENREHARSLTMQLEQHLSKVH